MFQKCQNSTFIRKSQKIGVLYVNRKVWSGQVRVFKMHIQSKLLLRTPVTGTGTGLRWGRGGKGGVRGVGGACTDRYKGVRAV